MTICSIVPAPSSPLNMSCCPASTTAPGEARALIRLLHGIRSKVNLIPFNPFAGTAYQTSSPETIRAFRDRIIKGGIMATIRKTRGDDILAACGQLAGSVRARTYGLREKPMIPHRSPGIVTEQERSRRHPNRPASSPDPRRQNRRPPLGRRSAGGRAGDDGHRHRRRSRHHRAMRAVDSGGRRNGAHHRQHAARRRRRRQYPNPSG